MTDNELQISGEDFKLIKSFYPDFIRKHVKSNDFIIGWSELMPVVEKIEHYATPNYYNSNSVETDYRVTIEISTDMVIITIHFKQPDTNKKRHTKQFTVNVTTNKIESVYQVVVEFIKWYNNQTK